MKLWQAFLIVAGTFGLDRASKTWVMLRLYEGEVWTLTPFFNLTHVTNTGVAFGLGQNFNSIFTGVALLLTVALLFWHRKAQSVVEKLALELLIAGALGNLYDRIVYGAVIDFLDFHAGLHHWPSFNVADSAITIGAALLIYHARISAKTDK